MRIVKSSLLAIGLMGLFAACGGSSKESTTPEAAPVEEAAPPADGTAPAEGEANPCGGAANPCAPAEGAPAPEAEGGGW